MTASARLLALLFAAVLPADAPAAADRDPPRWVTLGTVGGPPVSADAAQIANALVVGEAVYLFDVGEGVRRQLARANLPEQSIRAIFLSHHHVDHNADLGPLLVSHWTFANAKTIDVIGPAGTETLVNGLVAASEPTRLAAFPVAGPAPRPLGETVAVSEVAAGLDHLEPVYEDDNIRVLAIGMDHFQVAPSVPVPEMPDAIGFRIEAGVAVIAYTGDTGKTDRLLALAEDADLLVSEVVDVNAIAAVLRRSMGDAPAAAIEGIIGNIGRNHLEPGYIGEMASNAGVRKVVLTHYVPAPQDDAALEAYVNGVRATYDGPVVGARDLDSFEP